MTDTPRVGMPELAAAQGNPEITHNEALRIMDALVMCVVADKDLSEPPGAPSDGDMYIVGPTPSSGSAWNGEEDDIAYYKNTDWIYITPQDGWRVYVLDETGIYEFQGSSGWVSVETSVGANAYDMGTYRNGLPASGEVVLRIQMVRDVYFAADFAGSYAIAGAAPTGTVAYSIHADAVLLGVVTFSVAEGVDGVFTTASSTSKTIVAGEVLKITAPASQDATLEGVGIMLKGTKV